MKERFGEAGVQRWKSRLPFFLVLFSLLSLALVPVLVERRTKRHRTLISDKLEPARQRLMELQLALSQEAASTRAYLLTGDDFYARKQRLASERRQRAYHELRVVAATLSVEALAQVVALGRRLERPDDRFEALFAGRISPKAYLDELPAQQAAFQAVTEAVADLDRTMSVKAARQRMLIERTERRGTVATLILAVVALLAALLVARLSGRLRLLAHRLDDLLQREREARAETTSILESITDAFYTVDDDFCFTYVNRMAETIIQRPRDELLGKNIWDEFPDLVGTTAYHEHQRALRDRVTVGYELFYPPLGRWFEAQVYPSPRGLSVYFRDVTARIDSIGERERLLAREREARTDAERQREELQRVNESRAGLMRGFSHDVRNPLGVAQLQASMLEDGLLGDLTFEQRRGIQRIRRSIDGSLELIDDLLEMAQTEAGRLVVHSEPVDLAATAREVAEDFRPQAAAEGLELVVEVPELVPVPTDRIRVRQVLGNLLSNALKYTRKGKVTVSAERVGNGFEHGGWIAMRVSDTGPGISANDRERIFQEFTRLDPGARHGSGIGLAISRRIARLLGGDVTFESELGRGSTFTLWIPLEPRTLPRLQGELGAWRSARP